ncbi:hypothetical protein ABZT51_24425 [Streptomyces sp. NPDC005373]|uniref:hypothetical protein n=1 Tax=Streptomyces sp. NPDC005373 TaxID=3156879 RepID=UPI0033A8ADD1
MTQSRPGSADGAPAEAPYSDASGEVGAPLPAGRRRVHLALAGALGALLLTACAVDRLAEGRAESRTAEAFQDGMGTPTRPEVHVRGFQC